MTIYQVINCQLPPSGVGAHYQTAVEHILQQDGLQPVDNANPVVPNSATWKEALQHTEFFIGRLHDRYAHYRYRRYLEMLSVYQPAGARVALVDLGCGAGAFSWAFLDWASWTERPFDSINLYGYDHCPAMLLLAERVRNYILSYVPGYPPFRSSSTTEGLCDLLTKNHTPETSYLITLGHVLVQSHSETDLQQYSGVINHVVSLPNRVLNVDLLAVDAQSATEIFAQGWEALTSLLTGAGIQCEEFPVRSSYINDTGRAKRGRLMLKS